MLLSIVLKLQAKAAGEIHGGTGRAVHGFWFNQWQKTAAPVASALHKTNSVMPFTVSPLMDLPYTKRGTTYLSQGDKTWLRITTLHPELSQLLFGAWLPKLSSRVTLANIPWTIDSVALSAAEHPWAGQSDYQALLNHSPRDIPRKWRLTFTTPTTFRSGRNEHLPFPLPDVLVDSWQKRWQTFSKIPLPEALRTRLRQGLLVSEYRLKTVPVRQGKRLVIGCVGEMTLSGHKLAPEDRAIVTQLANYAFYAGSGHKTTQGMGMTRLQ